MKGSNMPRVGQLFAAEELDPVFAESEYIHEPPFAMQVELTEGCNLRCKFCGLNGIRGQENNFKFMMMDTVHKIIEGIKTYSWNPRIEFAMHGEPSMNPNFLKILAEFRTKLPKRTHLMVTSNGGGFLKNTTVAIDEALAHVNVLALDWYENVQIVPKILEFYKGKNKPRFYPKEPDANPHVRRLPQERDWVIIQDISKADTGTHSTLNNHAGAGAPKNDLGVGKRCAKPFREIAIRWDGSVAICCNDWRGEFKCGNVHTHTLDEIWNGSAMVAARRKLYHGQRDFGPCHGCDATSYRVGLLPDKKGKVVLPQPTGADLEAIEAALAGGPLTAPVLRPWEEGVPGRLALALL